MGSAPIPTAGTVIATPGQPQPLQPGEWVPSASPTLVSFQHQRISPPSALYVQTSELIVVNVNAQSGITDTVTVALRLLLPVPPATGQPDGTGSETPGPGPPQTSAITGVAPIAAAALMGHLPAKPAYIQQLVMTVPIVGGTPQTLKLPLQEGYLLSAAAIAASATVRGQVFVRCWLQQRALVTGAVSASMPLFADYVTQFSPIGWPLGRVAYPTEGPGAFTEVTVSNPAAGSDWTYTVPLGTRMRIESISATLTTSATAGSRVVRVQIWSVGGTVIWRAAGQAALTASTTNQVSAAPGQVTSVADTTCINLAMPAPTMLQPGEKIGFVTSGLLAGDQWSTITIASEQWLDGV